MGIWLAIGLFSLASCAPVTLGGNSSNPAAAPSPSPYSLSQNRPDTHLTSNAPIDNAQSTALTNYLHGSQLPLVGARVLASNGGPRQAILYGYVATPFGRADAIDKARRWLNDPGAQIDNRITIQPDLGTPADGGTATANNSPDSLDNPDLQRYQNQQNQQLTQQQRQYMNQGSPGFGGSGPLTLFLPLLGFGLGGGSGGMGFGGSSFGFGSGMSPYGSPYGSPYMSPYGSPYGPPYGP